MGVRILRLSKADITTQGLQPYSGMVVDVVCSNGQTHHGRLIQADNEQLLLADVNATWYNRKQHQHAVPLANIATICVSQHAPY